MRCIRSAVGVQRRYWSVLHLNCACGLGMKERSLYSQHPSRSTVISSGPGSGWPERWTCAGRTPGAGGCHGARPSRPRVRRQSRRIGQNESPPIPVRRSRGGLPSSSVAPIPRPSRPGPDRVRTQTRARPNQGRLGNRIATVSGTVCRAVVLKSRLGFDLLRSCLSL